MFKLDAGDYLGVPRTTPKRRWEYDLVLRRKEFSWINVLSREIWAHIEIRVLRGMIGIQVANNSGQQFSEEFICGTGFHKVTIKFPQGAKQVIFRNVHEFGESEYIVSNVSRLFPKDVDITKDLSDNISKILRSRDDEFTSNYAIELNIGRDSIRKFVYRGTQNIPINLASIFSESDAPSILESMSEVMKAVEEIDVAKLSKGQGEFDLEYVRNYLTQSAIRVFHLVQLLREYGLHSGRILDVGAYLGTFAVPLSRLGYQVTALDTFDRFDGALDPSIKLMTENGIECVQIDSIENWRIPRNLGTYDAVIAMAVIEHIPHTPRFFLEQLKAHVKHGGGLLAIDTPNVARYWNRQNLAKGEPIMQSISSQYYSAIPFTGHHREYTMRELKWMLEQLGLISVRGVFFDYNLLQFEHLSGEHREALLTMLTDPSQMDTILVCGRSGESETPS